MIFDFATVLEARLGTPPLQCARIRGETFFGRQPWPVGDPGPGVEALVFGLDGIGRLVEQLADRN